MYVLFSAGSKVPVTERKPSQAPPEGVKEAPRDTSATAPRRGGWGTTEGRPWAAGLRGQALESHRWDLQVVSRHSSGFTMWRCDFPICEMG